MHAALDLEGGWIGRISGNTNEHEPFLVGTAAVVDNLRADKGCVPVEYLLGRGGRVGGGPVVDGRFCHDSDGVVRYPLPEDNLLRVGVRFNLGLCLDVEYLQRPTGCTRNVVSQQSRSYDRSK